MGQVQVVFALHHVVGELIAHGKAQPVRLAVMTDDVQAADFWLFTRVFGKRRQRERFARPHDNAAIALVKPFGLHPGLACVGLTTLHAPFENAHGVGECGVVVGLLVHFVPGRGTAQVGKPGATDQHVGRVRVIQRRQDPAFSQQRLIVMGDAQPQRFDLLCQRHPGVDRGQCHLAHAGATGHFADQVVLHHAHAALAIVQFKLY